MTTLRTASKQALEVWDMGVIGSDLDRAMEILRAAMAQPDQEPVAWLNGRPLYYVPPRREWRGLDTEEIWGMTCECDIDYECAINFGKDIEAALKEKNT